MSRKKNTPTNVTNVGHTREAAVDHLVSPLNIDVLATRNTTVRGTIILTITALTTNNTRNTETTAAPLMRGMTSTNGNASLSKQNVIFVYQIPTSPLFPLLTTLVDTFLPPTQESVLVVPSSVCWFQLTALTPTCCVPTMIHRSFLLLGYFLNFYFFLIQKRKKKTWILWSPWNNLD